MEDNEIRDKAIQDAEKAEAGFDKEKQKLEIAEANFRRAKAEKEQMSTQMQQMQQQFEQQQKQIAELSAQRSADSSIADQLPDINVEDASIEDVAKVMAASKKIIAEQARKLASLETKASNYEQESAKEKAERQDRERKNQILNEVCSDLEEEFGSGLRNDAIKLFEKITEEQGAPENPAKAVLRLRKCFKQVKDTKATKGSRPLITDTGEGGNRPTFSNPKIKKGSLDDVADQYAKVGG